MKKIKDISKRNKKLLILQLLSYLLLIVGETFIFTSSVDLRNLGITIFIIGLYVVVKTFIFIKENPQ